MKVKVNSDCKYYKGEKPCKFKRLCEGCPHYEPIKNRFLIIKFGAIGDALRTTPILKGIKRKWENSHITWITDDQSYPLLKYTPLIDRLLKFDLETLVLLMTQHFDYLYCFEKVQPALGLAKIAKSKTKLGFKMDKIGNLSIYNPESEYALLLGLSDPLKFYENQKTYQEIIFEMVGLKYEKDEYVFDLPDKYKKWAKNYLKEKGVSEEDIVIGLNTGCGPVFATKKWTKKGFKELSEIIKNKYPEFKILLLGGPSEQERNKWLSDQLGDMVINTGLNPIEYFAGIVNRCDLIVTADTLAMHLAIALKKRVVVFFGSTCHQEVELYGRGEKIISDFDCSPCYLKECPKDFTCMDALTAERVFKSVENQLKIILDEKEKV